MRNILLRDTFRSIARNKLRFISVVIIVALGVSFYVGIKSASPKMRNTANDYFSECNLLDVRVTSRIPFSDDDINRISGLENVDSVIKSRYVDSIVRIGNVAIVDNNGMELSCRIGEIDSKTAKKYSESGKADSLYMNRLTLVDGRYPEKANECVIESRAIKDYKSISIGTVLTLNGDGASIADTLKSEKLTVVGTVDSPMYISADHGTTQVSAGSLSTYAYVDSSGFRTDDCNELFIKVKDSEEYDKFSTSYDEVVTELAENIQSMSSEIIDAKLVDIKAEYNKRIEEKENEINSYAESSGKQLSEKKKEIEEFKAYVDSEDEILAKEKKASEEKKKSTKSTLDSRKSSFNSLKTKYDANVKKYDGSSQKIDGYSELKKMYDDLSEKHDEDKVNLDLLESAKNAEFAKVETEQKNVKKAEKAVSTAENKVSELNEEISGLRSSISALESEKTSLEKESDDLDGRIADLQLKIDAINKKTENETADSTDRSNLREYKAELSSCKSEKKEIQSRISEISDSISSEKSSLEKKKSELEKANAKLPTVKGNLVSARNALELAKTSFDGAENNYNTAKTSYDADSATLSKYKKSMNSLTSGQTELVNLQQTIEEQKAQLDSLKVSLTVAQINYSLAVRDGDKKLLKAQAELNESKTRYEFIDEEYNNLKKEIDLKIENLNGDLKTLKNTLKNVESITWSAAAQTNLSGHKSFISSMSSIYSMSMIFPLIFLFTAMVASFVIMLKNVEDERNSIGLFKSFGYSPIDVTGKYLAYSTAAWLLGSILGVIMGIFIFPSAIYSIYGSIYNIPDINIAFNLRYIIRGMAASLITTTAATCVAVFKELRNYPAVLMRPKAISYNRRSLIEMIPNLWTRMSYGMVLLIRTVSRSRKRVVVGTMAIACCAALILSAFGLLNSASDVKRSQYGKDGVFCYDMQMVLNAAQEKEDSVILSKVQNNKNIVSGMLVCNIAYDASATSSRWNGFDSARILVPSETDNMKAYVNLDVIHGSGKLDNGKAVISEKMASDLKLTVGDTIYFTDTDSDVFSAEIGGVVKNYIDHYVYMSPETYEKTFNSSPEYKYIVCKIKDYLTENEIGELSSDFLKTDEVTGVITSDELADSVDISINQVLALVILFVASACILAAIVMYTIANVNISERTHEIANIKVIGFSNGEVLLYVIRENIVSTIVGAIIGLIGGIPLHHALMKYISVDNVMYGSSIFWWSFIAAALIIAAVAVAAALPIMIKINKVNVPETLKTVE